MHERPRCEITDPQPVQVSLFSDGAAVGLAFAGRSEIPGLSLIEHREAWIAVA